MAGDRVTRTIIVDVKGSPELTAIANGFAKMNKGISSAAGSLNFLKASFLGFSFFSIAKQVVQAADSMIGLSARLNVVSGNAEEAKRAMAGIVEVANQTKTSVDSAATIYTRLAISLKGAGLSSESLLGISKTLINTFRISGSTIQEATATAIQFSQALSANELRGQELRSITEQNATLTQILAKGFKGGVKELREFAKAGKLTNDVVLKLLAQNMDEVNKQADKMRVTFGQVLTVSFNKSKVAILEFVEATDLTAKFAAIMDTILNKFSLTLAVVSAAVLVLALSRLPALISGLLAATNGVKLLDTAFIQFARRNPLILALTAISIAVIALNKDFSELKATISDTNRSYAKTETSFSISYSEGLLKVYEKLGLAQSEGAKNIRKVIELENKRLVGLQTTEERIASGTATIADQAKVLADIEKANFGQSTKSRQQLLAELNGLYLQGLVSIDKYRQSLNLLEDEGALQKLKQGRINVHQFNEELRANRLEDLRSQLNSGIITFQRYSETVEQVKLESLNERLSFGKIKLEEFNKELVKTKSNLDFGIAAKVGLEEYLTSIGTITQGFAGAIAGTFTKLEDAIFDFTKTGKFQFNDFAQAVLDDLNRVLIRAYIIGPIVQGILGALGPSAPTNNSIYGSRIGGGPQALEFASGGVVSGRTGFSFGGGKSGVMGEAGPEAILPLSRGSDGSLGVSASVAPVNINIINNANAEVSTQESTGPGGERFIDVMIISKVKDGIANGIFDRTMQASFGLSRKGT